MAPVDWTIAAEQDVEEIFLYIGRERQSPAAAARVVEKIIDKASTYSEQPLLGEARPDLGESVRSFLAFDYIVLYRPIEVGIVVLRVLHGAQELRRVLGLL